MVRVLMLCSLAVVFLGVGFSVKAAELPAKIEKNMLVDTKGMTLYTFKKDTASGKSACNGPCATNWPPLMAKETDKPEKEWSVITRDDGKKQWAYKGKPLYLWKNDKKPGDKTGDKMNEVWDVATP